MSVASTLPRDPTRFAAAIDWAPGAGRQVEDPGARTDPGLIEHQLRRRAEPPFECRPPTVQASAVSCHCSRVDCL
jgi:hypothetical protein